MTQTIFSPLAETIYRDKYSMDGKEEWPDTSARVVNAVVGPVFPELVDKITQMITDRKFIPGGRYLRNAGRPAQMLNNCNLTEVEDSKEGWAYLASRVVEATMNSAGVGTFYSKLRSRGAAVGGMGGESTGPVSLMKMMNEVGRNVMGGGSRRAALWAGLHWNHPDIMEFIHLKDWSDDIKAMKEKDFSAVAPMDLTNISIILDDDFFEAIRTPSWHKTYPDGESGETYEVDHNWAQRVYWTAINQMLTTGEPGFSIDVGEHAGEHLRNPCTEVVSRDDNDICNIGSLNLALIESLEEMRELVPLATAFLLAGSVVSDVPYEATRPVREKNRRLGLGLMGVYEWLAVRGKPYAPDTELGLWLDEYALSGYYAEAYAHDLGVSVPVATRAMAPNGTIGMFGGMFGPTTTSIEVMYSAAGKRTYLKDGDRWVYQYYVDSVAEALVKRGVDPDQLETAVTLAQDPERRVLFQAWFQQWVDQGISSTINLPRVEDQTFTAREFGEMLLPYLPKLRGVTTYPDGARSGQPIEAVSYQEALDLGIGVEIEAFSNTESCKSGVCGI